MAHAHSHSSSHPHSNSHSTPTRPGPRHRVTEQPRPSSAEHVAAPLSAPASPPLAHRPPPSPSPSPSPSPTPSPPAHQRDPSPPPSPSPSSRKPATHASGPAGHAPGHTSLQPHTTPRTQSYGAHPASAPVSAPRSPRSRPPLVSALSAPSTATPFLDMSTASSGTVGAGAGAVGVGDGSLDGLSLDTYSSHGLSGLSEGGLGTPKGTPRPAGLVVSRAGMEATARGRGVVGVLCLKITLPKDGDGRQQRWELFQGPKPKLRSIPALYPLPASLALASTSKHIATAASLLSLPPPGAYPPAANDTGIKPYIDVSRTTDQVFVVVDSAPPPSAEKARRRSSLGGRSRSEWLVVIEFEAPIDEETTNDQTWFKTSIPTPKCLDNFIRFEIVPPDPDCASAEIVTMPRVLPLPSPAFDHDSSPSKRRFEDGWEDGEVPGASSSEGSDDHDSSWLRGRYQSTDVVALQWGFAPVLGTPPDLRIAPHWDAREPSVGITFEAVVAALEGPFGIEAVLPPGWGWSSLQIRADGLFSWRSADLEGLGALVSATATGADDSMSTVMEGPSDLASLDAADFSFENSYRDDERPAMPATPSLRRIERHGAAVLKVVPRTPTPASIFVLEFERPDEDEDDDRVLLIEGTLVPLPLTLVSPDVPLPIPYFRFEDASLPTDCDVKCPGAALVPRPHTDDDDDSPSLCDTSLPSVGTFAWTDPGGALLPARATAPVSGIVRANIKRSIWGLQTLALLLPWPSRADELRVGLYIAPGAVRVVRASARGTPLPTAIHARVVDGAALADVRVARGRGAVELVLEVADDAGVALPLLEGVGELRVELAGDGWDKPLAHAPETNLERTGERAFAGALNAPYITFTETPALPTPPPIRTPTPVATPGADLEPPDDPEIPESPAASPASSPAPETTPLPTQPTETEPQPTPTPLFPSALPAAVVKPSRARTLLASAVSWNTLVNLVLLWILGSLAGQVARLRAEVAFVADETRDLRLYGFDGRDAWRRARDGRDRGGDGREWERGPEEEKWREDPRRVRTWADSAVADADAPRPAAAAEPDPDPDSDSNANADSGADAPPPQPAADAQSAHTSAVHAAEEYDLAHEPKAVPAVAAPTHGLGRVVRPIDWGAWLAHHPSVRAVQDTLAWLWGALRALFA